MVRRTLGAVDTDLVEVAAVLTDEIVANAIRHGRPPIELAVHRDDEGILIAVADCGPGVPAVQVPDHSAEAGRGLRIVDVLADAWGVSPMAEGKRVWFRLRVPGAGNPQGGVDYSNAEVGR